jgi:hypothetical protein
MKFRTITASALAGAALVLTPATAMASTGHGAMIVRDHQRACRFRYSASHNADSVAFTFTQTCGKSLRAYGDWQNAEFHYGTYRKTPPGGTKYSVACAVSSTCGSGGGSFWSGGYQRKDTGAFHCLWGCSAHTTAINRVPGPCDQGTVHDGIGISPGSLTVWWNPDSDSSTTDGCASLWAQVKDDTGHVTTGGMVYYDNGIKSGATARSGRAVWGKAWMFINGCNQWKYFFSPNGPSNWKVTTCPAIARRAV